MKVRSVGVGTQIDDVDLRVISDSLPLISWTSSPRGVSESLNKRGKHYTGLDPQPGDVWDWFSCVHVDDVKVVRRHWRACVNSTSEFSHEYRLHRFDGVYRWHAVRALPIYDARGHVRTWIGTAVDIDDKIVADQSLDRSLRSSAEMSVLLDAIISDAPVGIAFVDRNYRVIRLNEVLASTMQTTVEENIGRLVPDAIPLLWPEVKRAFDTILAGGPPIHDVPIERPSSRDSKRIYYWSANYFPVGLGDEIIGIGVVVEDRTSQHDRENQHLLMSTIVEGSGDAIYSATNDGIITSWNESAERLFGYTAKEIVGRSVDLLVPTEHRLQLRHAQERVIREKVSEHFTGLRLDRRGNLINVEMTVSPIIDTTGTVVGVSRIAHDETEQREREERLRESQSQLVETQRIAHVGGMQYDVVGDQMIWSDETFRILGLDPKVTPTTQLFLDRVHEADKTVIREAWGNTTLRGTPFDVSFRITRPGGEERYVSARAEIEFGNAGTPIKMTGTISDLTERVEAEKRRRSLELRYEASFEQSAIGTAIFSLEGISLRVNQEVCNFFGRPREELLGRDWAEFTSRHETPVDQVMASILGAGNKSFAYERSYVRPDGHTVQASVHVIVVRDDDGAPLFLYSHLLDITEHKKVVLELAHSATHDHLTDLPNQALLSDRLAQSLARTKRNKTNFSVMFLDIDDFKEINDSLGHNYGNELLIHVAKKIAATVRPADTVARFGGDEFVVICEGANDQEINKVADRVLHAINEPLTLAGTDVRVTGSIGIAASSEESTSDSLLRNADFAMYRAKNLGPGSVAHYDVDLHEQEEQRLATTTALRLALARNEFIILYQPVIDIWTGSLVALEALVRWEHPTGVTVSPDEFVPLAENSGLIVPIGAWVLEQACAQVVTWQEAVPDLGLAVNLSVRQVLDPSIVATVRDTLDRTKVPPGLLSLELTESLLMEDVEESARTLNDLKNLKVKLVIDDFGTGYSSLSYLKLFPFDTVKIDRAFVDGLGSDPHDSALVAAIIAMSNALELDVIAEGVETHEQLTRLKSLGCPRAQGFYFSRPVSALKISQLILEGRQWDAS